MASKAYGLLVEEYEDEIQEDKHKIDTSNVSSSQPIDVKVQVKEKKCDIIERSTSPLPRSSDITEEEQDSEDGHDTSFVQSRYLLALYTWADYLNVLSAQISVLLRSFVYTI